MFQENCSSGGRGLQAREEISYVNAEEAKNLVAAKGYSILDIRDGVQYERAHIKQCYHVPLFIENQDNDFGTIIKRTLHNNFAGLFFGLSFTKLNPDFLRSSAAANQLEQAGFQNIACITSGLQSVSPGTYNSVGSTELQSVGKAGLVTQSKGKTLDYLHYSMMLGGAHVTGAFLFITFFPDQAEKLFQLAPSS